MSDQQFSGVTPVGRVISHAIFEPTMKGFQNKPLDKPLWYIQLAVSKTDPGLKSFFEDCKSAASAGFFNNEPERPDFAWKYKDGDTPENNGRDGWSGCYIFSFRSGFAPSAIVDQNNKQIITGIIPGYQVQVAYGIKANEDTNKPGIYLNFYMVKLISIDAPIISGPSADEVFGKTPDANPMQPDAVATPAGGFPTPQGVPLVQPVWLSPEAQRLYNTAPPVTTDATPVSKNPTFPPDPNFLKGPK